MNGYSEQDYILLAQQGNQNALEELIEKYSFLVNERCRKYYLPDGEWEDLRQEGLIGLYFALRDYRAEKEIPFSAFARMCIARAMIDAIRIATAQRKLPQGSWIPLHEVKSVEAVRQLTMDVEEWMYNPERFVLHKEFIVEVKDYVQHHLTRMERMVMFCVLMGYSYRETGERVQRGIKSVDNSMRRIYRKLEGFHRG